MIDHYKKLRTALRIRRDLVLDLLSQHMPEGVSWGIPEGGLNVWISLPSRLDSNHVLLEAKKQQLTFLPGSACYPVEQENHHLRVSYSYMNEPLLQQGITTLCNILHSQLSSKQVHDSAPFF
jgi:DNA-binding transcriptional MocR family regulator